MQRGCKERSPDDLGLSSLSPWAGCGADYGGGEYWGTMLKVKESGGFSWEEGGAADGPLDGIPIRTS